MTPYEAVVVFAGIPAAVVAAVFLIVYRGGGRGKKRD
jgi:hypothetical protein